MITLQKSVVLPWERLPLVVEGKEHIEAVQSVVQHNQTLVLQFGTNGGKSRIGVLVEIIQSWSFGPLAMSVVVQGLRRVQIDRTYNIKHIPHVEITEIQLSRMSEHDAEELEALSRSVFDQFKQLVQLLGIVPLAVANQLNQNNFNPDQTSDVVAASLKLGLKDKLEMLEVTDPKHRLEILSNKLNKELNIAKTEKKIRREAEKEMTKLEREYILKEHLKAIEKELGIFGEQKEYDDLERTLNAAGLPKEIYDRAIKELYRLRKMSGSSAEAPYVRTYLELIAELPWNKESPTKVDLRKAREVLDKDHFGLEKVKNRILEHLAVQKLTSGKGRSNILCFVGPPGTGKTSVGHSIASALGRAFHRISLGGVHDEAEIRGHRRTYVGALPGRIIQGIRNSEVRNPVFMMDEIDKVGTDFRGDPSSALLEVLDPEQNKAFYDNYLEFPFDLSHVFFIATANVLDTVPPALRDRMEVIEFSGYTDIEKFSIAKLHLLPNIILGHGLSGKTFELEDKALRLIINKYTREAGVRNLERKLSEIARKVAYKITARNSKSPKKISVGEDAVFDYLGPEEFEVTMREEQDEIGVATGLAWTPAGGEIIFIEATQVPGKGGLILTGHLGKVMQESARAAVSYVRSKTDELKLQPDFYTNSDIHIHVPSGAIRKDGPSAGIAIAAAVASAISKKKVKKEIALTGEITLSGKVLKIGGVKEKVLAAHRAGAEFIILPQDNHKDIRDVPKNVRKELKFKFVKHMDDVLKTVFIRNH